MQITPEIYKMLTVCKALTSNFSLSSSPLGLSFLLSLLLFLPPFSAAWEMSYLVGEIGGWEEVRLASDFSYFGRNP